MAAIDWVHTYNPRVLIGSTVLELPRPLQQVEENFANDYKSIKIPLRDGVLVSKVSRGALNVSFSGIISCNTMSGVLYRKQKLLDTFMNANGQRFTMYRHYDSVRGNYRWYENCICTALVFSNIVKHKFSLAYSFTIVVPSGYEKELVTTRGESPGSDPDGLITVKARGGYGGSPVTYFGDNTDGSDFSLTVEAVLPEERSYLYGPLLIKLADSAGASSFLIQNSDGDFIFRITSDGNVYTTQPINFVDTITYP